MILDGEREREKGGWLRVRGIADLELWFLFGEGGELIRWRGVVGSVWELYGKGKE